MISTRIDYPCYVEEKDSICALNEVNFQENHYDYDSETTDVRAWWKV